MESIVNRELHRKSLYKQIVKKIDLFFKSIGRKCPKPMMFLYRYIINKIPFRTEQDDPVFIVSESKLSKRMVDLDYQYFRLNIKTKNALIDLVESELQKCADVIKNTTYSCDPEIFLSHDQKLHYGRVTLRDINHLAEKNLDLAMISVALQIRYRYMIKEGNHFAIDYKTLSRNQCGESFVSSLTNYFHEHAGFFPDLESYFGSRTSLFDYDDWKSKEIFLYPPRDQVFIEYMIDQVLKSQNKTFMIYLPYWIDIDKIRDLKDRSRNYCLYIKDELEGVNRFISKKYYNTCDMLVLYIEQ